MLGRRKGPTVETVEEVWSLARGDHRGDLLVVRIRTGFAAATDRDRYPMQIGVALPVLASSGYPNDDENTLLQEIEDLVVLEAGDRAILVAALTTKGVRELVLYARTGEWIEAFHQRLQSLVDTHEVQCMAQMDPGWSTYFRFCPEGSA